MNTNPRSEADPTPLLAFLGLYTTAAQDGFLGAVLVTDIHGVPQEFKCTYPVRPTAVRTLYGEALEPHIGVNLCGARLIQSLQHKPFLVIVNREYLTRLRQVTDCPVAFVQNAGEALAVTAQSGGATPASKARVESSMARFPPIVVSTDPAHADELPDIKDDLESGYYNVDPTEPFQRMLQALDVLAKQDAKYR